MWPIAGSVTLRQRSGSDSMASRSSSSCRSSVRTSDGPTEVIHAPMRSGGSSETRSTSSACVRAPDSSRA